MEYIATYNIPYAPVYGEILKDAKGKYYTTGEQRTGCVYCMFGAHLEKSPNRFERLKETHPMLYNYCMKERDKNGLGLKQVLDYLNIKY